MASVDVSFNRRKYANREEKWRSATSPAGVETGRPVGLTPAEVQAMEQRNAEREVCLRCTRPKCFGSARCFREEMRRQAIGGGGKVRLYEYNGQQRTIREWAEVTGIKVNTLRERIDAGWPMKRVIEAPVRANGRPCGTANVMLEFRGEVHTVMEWAAITGLSGNTIRSRLRRRWDVERALTTPAAEVGRRMMEE